jgi:hypothetical protein
MEGVKTKQLCEFLLTAIWKDQGIDNTTGINGEAMHAHALESLVHRIKHHEV